MPNAIIQKKVPKAAIVKVRDQTEGRDSVSEPPSQSQNCGHHPVYSFPPSHPLFLEKMA
jgi:hypothetical protein